MITEWLNHDSTIEIIQISYINEERRQKVDKQNK